MGLSPGAEYNLRSSGLSEPNLSVMGVDTSFDRFAAEKDDHARLFAEAIAELYHVEPDNVVITNGASEAIFLVYSVFGTGGKAIVPLPNYEAMLSVPQSLGMHVNNSLARASTVRGAVCELTDPNNPTGRSLDKGIFSNVIRFRRVSMPYQAAYLAFFVASLIVLLTVLRPSDITTPYFFALLVIAVAAVIAVYEAIKTLRRL